MFGAAGREGPSGHDRASSCWLPLRGAPAPAAAPGAGPARSFWLTRSPSLQVGASTCRDRGYLVCSLLASSTPPHTTEVNPLSSAPRVEIPSVVSVFPRPLLTPAPRLAGSRCRTRRASAQMWGQGMGPTWRRVPGESQATGGVLEGKEESRRIERSSEGRDGGQAGHGENWKASPPGKRQWRDRDGDQAWRRRWLSAPGRVGVEEAGPPGTGCVMSSW